MDFQNLNELYRAIMDIAEGFIDEGKLGEAAGAIKCAEVIVNLQKQAIAQMKEQLNG